MISVKSQRSDEVSAVILSQHRPTFAGLRSAYVSYTWWVDRFSRVYPTKSCRMDLWMEYRGSVLDPDMVCAAINGELGQWAHVSKILDEMTVGEVGKIPA